MGRRCGTSLAVTMALLGFLSGPQLRAAEAAPGPAAECEHFDALRQPFFGDLHVHTRYSLDASTQDTRTTPAEAYAFARGEPLGIQPWAVDGAALRTVQLDRPLDFAAVTDHAELFGEVVLCTDPQSASYSSWQCRVYRRFPRVAFYLFNFQASQGNRLGMCGEDGALCREAGLGPWQEMQNAAAFADREGGCAFTSFVGYEWTGASANIANLHRNVIFGSAEVPRLPISFLDANTAPKLWRALDETCVTGLPGCEVIVIPHNSNLSDGQMFLVTQDDGSPITAADAEQRQRLERLVEVMQHKGSSECYYGPMNTADELCAFEQLPYDKFSGNSLPLLAEAPTPEDGFLREVMSVGLAQERALGVNPFKWGFIGSTDTHLGTAGLVAEKDFPGHGGAGVPAGESIPAGMTDNIEYNPGGLAVLWAEENTRASLFAALKRREVYGTSGPRITVRLFAGADLPDSLCEADNFAEAGYARGVPMGADLPAMAAGQVPRFAVSAQQDPGVAATPGLPLQRIQIIKGWVDAAGAHQERVFEVAGDPGNGASVNLKTCQPRGEGFSQLCGVWRDPDFDPARSAWYYARVVENPSCRWSQHICVANKVDCSRPETIGKGLEACCSADHQPVIQERAWTSPVWYRAPGS